MKNNSIADFVAASMDAALKSEEYKTLFGTQYKTAGDKMCAKCHEMHGDKDSCMADDNAAKKSKDSKDSGDSSYADDNDAKKSKDSSSSSSKGSSSKDSSSADDNAAKKSMKDSKDSSKADDNNHMGSGAPKDRDHGEYDKHFADGKDPSTGAVVSHEGAKIEFPVDKVTGKPAHAADSHSANTLDSTTANPYPGKQYDADEYRNGDVLKADDSDDKVSSAYDVAIDSLLTASAALDHVNLGCGSAISLKLASLVVEAKKKEKDSKKSSKDSKKSDSHSAKDKKSKDSKDSKKSDSHSAKDKKSDSKKSDSKKSDSKDSKKSSKK